MYAMICTRPDVSYALSMTSRYQSNPGEGHRTTVKNIIKCLKGTKDSILVYGGDEKLVVKGYTDASFQTDRDDSVSQSGFVFYLNGVDLFCDNNGAIVQVKELRFHSKVKHVLRRYHLLREINGRGDIHIGKVHIDDHRDPLTKDLSQQKHDGHTSSMELASMSWIYNAVVIFAIVVDHGLSSKLSPSLASLYLIQGYRSRPGVVKSYYWKDFIKSNEWTEKIILLVKTIDLGAAADLRVGINYVSKEFLLDPRSLLLKGIDYLMQLTGKIPLVLGKRDLNTTAIFGITGHMIINSLQVRNKGLEQGSRIVPYCAVCRITKIIV
ncbi:hypothetical protein AgCh_004793 [Apium graveolens]